MGSQDGSDRRRRLVWSDTDMDQIIGHLLRVGLMCAAAVVSIGAIIYLIRHGGETAAYRVFQGEPIKYRSITGILGEMERFRGRGFILAGILVLMSTPVARVAFSVIAFLRKKDTVYVLVTAFVLAILLFSLLRSG
jgi:uncharacterized membrane protein